MKSNGTKFQIEVWNQIKKIPKGTVKTYKEIALILNKPRSSRAVANACGKNPYPPKIPCHRVIRSDGYLGGYSGKGGIKAKQKSVVVLEDIQWDVPKTKNYLQMLAALGLADKKSVLVLGDLNKNVYLSSRNLKNSKVVINSELNTYNISNANSLVFCEGAIAGLESILNRS